MAEYTGSDIVVLDGLEAVRKRPGMYIGSTGYKGLHHMIWEIIDNGIDEHLGGFCNKIVVTLQKDGGISIQDNGRGVPTDLHAKGIPTIRVVYTILHAGGKFGSGAYKVSGGLHGVGAAVVNALSEKFFVEVHRNGEIVCDEYAHGGHPVTELVDKKLPVVGKCPKNDTGTKVTFYPDPAIFENVDFKPETISKKMKEMAFLNKGLTLVFDDKINGTKQTFYESQGIKSYVDFLTVNQTKIIDEPIYVTGFSKSIEVEVAFTYVDSQSEMILSYCNRINTVDGGTAVTGFKKSLTKVINQYARDLSYLKEKDENFDGKDIRNGLVAIISIKHPDPQFEGQTKSKLGSTDATPAVDDVFFEECVRYFDRNVNDVKILIERTIKAMSARKAGDKARNAAFKSLNDFNSNSKLAACSSKKASECEIYIVEGDSAGGTVKTARNRRTQAVLPLRGKIINVEKAPIEKILANNEIKTMISAFGCGIDEAFDITKLRYDKIIILTDADVDGAHISNLLLTFFFRFMPELIYSGKVFRGLPPLYKVDYEESGKGKKTKKSKYLLDDKSLEEFKKENHKIISQQRYKGLGEMDADQLWETTLDPERRTLAQVSIQDVAEADEVTNLLMGTLVPPRREFIINEAQYAKLDV
ncbi:MAG: DNA gyrase subunit B [Lachnospiraceae bacterium]|nr:DNA gyrase subunit B [Lachnospiraceae bacterium]